MTDNDKALVERLRDGDHLWMTDRQEIADRIEAQAAEIARLREAMDAMSRAAIDGDLRKVVDIYLSVRAALGGNDE